MLPASADFLAEEAKLIGATPIVRFTWIPKYLSSGLESGGIFVECGVDPLGRILADYHGFALGYWIGPQMPANLGRYPSEAIFTWDWNSPGYEMAVFWRTARTLELLALTSWSEAVNGDTVSVNAYYQLKVEWRGYRCWAIEG